MDRCQSSPTRQIEATADRALCYRWRDHHDISAARQLAGRYRWLVIELADSYRDSGLPTEDLTAEGSMGLMRAICRFDPDRGLGFATFGTWWVNTALQDFVRSSTEPRSSSASVLPPAPGRAAGWLSSVSEPSSCSGSFGS